MPEPEAMKTTCAVCAGGWSHYWKIVFSGATTGVWASVCPKHVEESRAALTTASGEQGAHLLRNHP